MSTQNSNAEFFRFVLDTETTDLGIHLPPVRRLAGSNLQVLMSEEQLRNSFSHLDITQVGYKIAGGQAHHVSVAVNSRWQVPRDSIVQGSTRETTVKVGNSVISTKANLVKYNSLADNTNIIMGGKGTDAFKKAMVSRSREKVDAIHEVITPDKRRLLLSKVSMGMLEDQGELGTASDILAGKTKLAQNLTKAHNAIYSATTQVGFEGKGKDSLYRIIEDLYLSNIRKGTKVVHEGHNAMFDIERMRGMLVKFGHMDMLAELDRAYYSGMLQVDGLEKLWQAMTYKLTQENPDMMKSFLIHLNPEAVAATGRPGRMPTNFKEWSYAAPWNANEEGQLLSYSKAVRASMPEGHELHAAGSDANLERAEANELLSLYKAYSREAGITGIGSIEEFIAFDSKDSKLMTKILDARIKKGVKGVVGENTVKSVEEFKAAYVATALKKNKYIREKGLGIVGESLAASTGNKLLKYGGISTAIAAIMLTTYGLASDKEYDPSKSRLSKGTMFGKKTPFSDFKAQFEHDPNKTKSTLALLGYGVSLPVLGLYGIGLSQAYAKPKLFGRKVKLPSSISEASSEFLKTVRFGARFMESSFPITRVFRSSSMINMMMGRSNLVYDEGNQSFTRAVKMTTWESGNQRLLYENTNVREYTKGAPEGVMYNELLDKAKQTIHPNEYAKLENFFNPVSEKLHKDTAKTIVQIGNTKNGSIVVFREINDLNNPIEASRVQRVRLPFKVQDWKNKETDAKNFDSSYRHAKIRKSMTDPIVHNRVEEDLFNYGYSKRFTLEQYLSNNGIVKAEHNKLSLKNIWNRGKYFFELDKKGVGEYGNNLFEDMAFFTRKVNTIVAPKDYKRFKGLASEFTIRGMNTFLESPLELIGMSPQTMMNWSKQLAGGKHLPTRLLGVAAKYMSRSHLGLTNYDLGKFPLPKYLAKFATKRLLPAALAWEAFRVTDHILGAMTFSKGQGPITTGAIKAYEWSSLIYSKISDVTGFTRINKRQEKVAPGSGSLGIFVPSLTAVSLYKSGELFYRFGSDNFRKSVNNMASKFKDSKFGKKALAEEVFKGARNKSSLERYFSWAVKNPKQAIFSFMMLPMIPFVPGLIGSSKSYKERKAEYDGKKEVAIRKYRGWLLSSSAYEGGKATQFRRHALNLVEGDWENKGVIWPSFFKRAAHDMSLGLIGRYELEEYHAKDQPVYKSSPWGANIPMVGPAIAATLGRFVKPTRTYHEMEQGDEQAGISPYSHGGAMIGDHTKLTDKQLIGALGVKDEGSTNRLYHRMSDQFRDLIGFRGFLYETAKGAITGQKNPDEFTPYAQDATEMYNPANSMWQYQLGDITVVGGEFLRRLFVFPEKLWRVNNIPNELNGVSWIPQQDETNEFKKFGKDLTHGTTFDKVQMGWLYGSRKGWEYLYPTVKGSSLEEYPDPIRMEILKQMAPYSNEFNQTAQKVMDMAVGNELTPYQEQRYYDTLDQVRQVKEQVYAHDQEYAYTVSTHKEQGVVSSVDDDGNFTLGNNAAKYKLAGVSTKEEDLRHALLQKNKYTNALDLDEDVKNIQAKTTNIISKYMGAGRAIDMEVADFDQMVNSEHGIEATVGNLNRELIDAGAVRANTGNISKYNMQQDDLGMGSSSMAKYWDAIIPTESFWSTKLINKKNYIEDYLYKQVFNREVKLWSKPIEQLLKPFIATELHRMLGIDLIPSFTTERRKDQEYWDVIKYVKYKMLASRAKEAGDEEGASQFHNLWRTTMLGADPTDENTRDELAALPANERAYFTKFSEEPDPKKRGKILKYLPAPAKRIYSAIWAKKEAEAGNQNAMDNFERLQSAEGWDVSDKEREQWQKDTNGQTSLGDYVRGKYVSEFAKDNGLPDASWLGWSEDIDIEDVELLSLKEGGRNIQDYGFFDNKARVAAYNGPAYTAAMDINSISGTSSQAIGAIMPYMMASDNITMSHGMPTASKVPISNNTIETNQHDEVVKKHNFMAIAAVDDVLNILVKAL